jgi:hypothetical protein
MSTGLGRGRPTLPSAVKAARGTTKPSRVNRHEPKVEAAPLPAPPKDWPSDRQAAWTWLARLIDPMRVAAAGDVASFRRFVICWCKAEELADDDDAFDQWAKAERLAQGWLVHFGLSPVARAKAVQLEKVKTEHDPLAEFVQ